MQLLSTANLTATETAVATNAADAEKLCIIALVDEVQPLLCKILPADLLSELKNANTSTTSYANIFASYIRRGDSSYTTNHADIMPLKSHTLLANLYCNPEDAIAKIQRNPLAGFTGILSGLCKIYAHEAAQHYAKFRKKLMDVLVGYIYAYKKYLKYPAILYFSDIFDMICVYKKRLLVNQQELTPAISDQNSATFDFRELKTSILQSIPENLYASIVYDRNCALTNKEHWKKYWLKCFLSHRAAPTNFVVAELYFNPANFLAQLTTKKLITQVLIDLFIDLAVLRQHAITVVCDHWEEILAYAKGRVLPHNSENSEPNELISISHERLADLEGAILPL